MSKLAEIFLTEISPDGCYFAVVIMKDNIASLRLAEKLGFSIYDQDGHKAYF